ncbi:hypothetical protein HPB48_013751 [Haemaphysalis longicornis]|uniref:Uncharacterized protein n=1 Tax=Haemaphysalis longicornis TaxID=44386 RepID=A0A9J6FUP1_HAELO|nr:hypothetical protein HPB48_013751 [Haemaphysalis longicornis]
MQEVLTNGKCHGVRFYAANDPSNARGVIHGIFTDVPDETLREELHITGRKILAAQRLGKTNTILITVEGRNFPRHATFFPAFTASSRNTPEQTMSPLPRNRTSRRSLPKQK